MSVTLLPLLVFSTAVQDPEPLTAEEFARLHAEVVPARGYLDADGR